MQQSRRYVAASMIFLIFIINDWIKLLKKKNLLELVKRDIILKSLLLLLTLVFYAPYVLYERSFLVDIFVSGSLRTFFYGPHFSYTIVTKFYSNAMITIIFLNSFRFSLKFTKNWETWLVPLENMLTENLSL